MRDNRGVNEASGLWVLALFLGGVVGLRFHLFCGVVVEESDRGGYHGLLLNEKEKASIGSRCWFCRMTWRSNSDAFS